MWAQNRDNAGAISNVLKKLANYLAPPPIRARSELLRFLGGESSYLAQRATYEFCRNTLSYFGQGMFEDPGFNDAMRVNRWESYAAILADAVVLARNRLSVAETPDALNAAMTVVFESAVSEYPLTLHRTDWNDRLEALRGRLADESLHRCGPSELSRCSARRVFETLPVYSHDKQQDYEGIERALRFGLIAIDDRMERRFRAGEIATDLRQMRQP
jgi:hypothetical protein